MISGWTTSRWATSPAATPSLVGHWHRAEHRGRGHRATDTSPTGVTAGLAAGAGAVVGTDPRFRLVVPQVGAVPPAPTPTAASRHHRVTANASKARAMP